MTSAVEIGTVGPCPYTGPVERPWAPESSMSEQDPSKPPLRDGVPSSDAPASGSRAAQGEALFAHLFDVSPFGAVVTRLRDHIILAINQYTSEIFGVPQSEALGQSVLPYYVESAARVRLADTIRRDGRANSLRFQVRRQNGEAFWVLASARLVTFDGEPAVLTVFNDISDQIAAEQALRANEQRLAAQSKALTELTGRQTDRSGAFDQQLRDILAAAAQTLQVERVSMWRIDDQRRAIHCVSLFQRTANRYESGAVLHREAAPDYFDALERDRVIAAENVRADPRTREFLDTYLMPNGIGAMLDIPLRQDNTMSGVLCAEHVGGPREWMVDEQNFAVSTANLIVVAAADEDRRQALARLAESDARAHLILETAHDAFVGMDASGRIVTWNAKAESMFGWSRDTALGRSLVDTIIPPSLRETYAKAMQRIFETGDAPIVNNRLELMALHREGREFPIEVITITSPMRLGDSQFFGAFLRDISERHERDEERRRAKESAE